MKKTLVIGVGLLAGLIVFLAFRRKANADEAEPNTSGGGTAAGGGAAGGGAAGGGVTPGTAGTVIGNLGGIFANIVKPEADEPLTPVTHPEFNVIIHPDPTPGDSPVSPMPSKSVYAGFEGYIIVEEGDNMTKIGNRLGIPWKAIVQHPDNKWLAEIFDDHATATQRAQYPGGEGFLLNRRYGAEMGVDCTAPGWHAAWKSNTSSSYSWPVMHWSKGF